MSHEWVHVLPRVHPALFNSPAGINKDRRVVCPICLCGVQKPWMFACQQHMVCEHHIGMSHVTIMHLAILALE